MSTGNTGTVSTHFNFTLPGYDDDTDIDDLNTNFNIIDTSLYDAVQDIATNASDISSLRDSVGKISVVNQSDQKGLRVDFGSDVTWAISYYKSTKLFTIALKLNGLWQQEKTIANW